MSRMWRAALVICVSFIALGVTAHVLQSSGDETTRNEAIVIAVVFVVTMSAVLYEVFAAYRGHDR